MELNLSVYTTVEQCDKAIADFQGRRIRATMAKAVREGKAVAKVGNASLIPQRIAQLDAEISTAEEALANAQSTALQIDAEIELGILKLERARLMKRSLKLKHTEIVKVQLDVERLDGYIEMCDQMLVALEKRKGEILGG
jgi:hypothetical protein